MVNDDIETQKFNFERLKHARDRWWYEEKLINQRLTWFFNAQGLLGLGYAWLRYRIAEIQASPNEIINLETYIGQLEKLALFLLVLGLLVSIVTAIGVHAAVTAQSLLKSDPENIGFKLDVSASTTLNGMLLAYSMPIISIFAWSASLIFLR